MTSRPLASLLFSAFRPLVFPAAIAAIVPFACAATAQAEDAPAAPDAEALFKQLDANADGMLTTDEVPTEKQRLLERLFRTADDNKDGKLSREEFVASLKSRAEPSRARANDNAGDKAGGKAGERLRGFLKLEPDAFFRRMDANGDGKVTPDEVPEERRERFTALLEKADANSNGALDRDEFVKVRERLTAADPEPSSPPASGSLAPRASDERANGGASREAVFLVLDKDGDGKLSPDEISKAADSLAALDKDGDGSITPAELQRTRKRSPSTARGGGQAGFDADRAWQRLLNGDKNNDGKLSQDELPERLQQAFSRLDQNGDGFADESEVKTGLKRLREAIERKQP